MRYSRYEREKGVYRYFDASFPPKIEIEENEEGNFGFLSLQSVKVGIPSNDPEGSGRIPEGIIASDYIEEESDVVGDLLGFAAKVWLVGVLLGRW